MVRVLKQDVTEHYALYQGDCVDVMRGMPEGSVHYSIFSPPFASLYTYSASPRDMGNCANHTEFHEQHQFMIEELLRVTMPGRLASVHCMLIPTSKMRDGFIGLSDFRGDIIRAFQRAGWYFHSEVTIWKDPVTAMQRTKALGLLHKQIRKDSTMSRQGIPDYLVTFRKPGDNPERVAHVEGTSSELPVDLWQRYASPVWAMIEDQAVVRATTYHRGDVANPRAKASAAALDDLDRFHTIGQDISASDTLQYRSARADEDEKHIAPLQLEVIRRAIRLWTNPGDVVFSPFGGIGSEGYVALQEGRRAVLAELKDSYFAQQCANLASLCAVAPVAKNFRADVKAPPFDFDNADTW